MLNENDLMWCTMRLLHH